MLLNKQSMTALKCKYITASVYMSGSSPWKYCYWYILHNQLTSQLMKHSPYREENSSSPPSREISHVLPNLKVHYCVHKSLPLVLVLSRINRLRALPSCSFKIHSKTVSLKYILKLSSYAPLSSKWSLCLRFTYQNFICNSALPCTVPPWYCPLIIFGKQYT